MGFTGVLWSPEVRGGAGRGLAAPHPGGVLLAARAVQRVGHRTKLWTHAEVADDIRDAIQLRMRLLPYWYTAFAQYHYQGTPVVRPMPLVEGFTPPVGQDPNAITDVAEVKDQYLVGDVLLVAPIRPGAKSRRVVLPAGRWYDFYTGPSCRRARDD